MIFRVLNLVVIGALVLAAAYVYRIKFDATVQAERLAAYLALAISHQRLAEAARDAALDRIDIAQVDRAHRHAERRRRGLDSAETGGSAASGGIADDDHARHAWRNLLESSRYFADRLYS